MTKRSKTKDEMVYDLAIWLAADILPLSFILHNGPGPRPVDKELVYDLIDKGQRRGWWIRSKTKHGEKIIINRMKLWADLDIVDD